ncbi:similar to Saccharomyces cerevisiae YLR361C DCR2 Phosphoesterase involved in downregulation of the unfolded protein response, at least in part via dephosphorylation of Ire1p [Maudiozyma saulgeensis]|uniref:Similar to Saccharomyces cerevisiae YLR361C DCR2 Phosphoesterase involved in downregulation of the unfolded protein response, at least in part via dephosphorylation of Ire1p n=1 Tax=Maudiozyma saulgeensis TaxID=1789683 RepID=A0A1X7RAJ4_9SACH|nr:similar to Saccharomyces cerevisiae YLR361C DCR2 Phosphoesterase involved in downregulation of the unfolded protein response, at least in part via dephosphorylation of Ire1p [Kazachstania saulgeensis]
MVRSRLSKRYVRLLPLLVLVLYILCMGYRHQRTSNVRPVIKNNKNNGNDYLSSIKSASDSDSGSRTWQKDEIVGLLSSNHIDLGANVDIQYLDMNQLVITNLGIKKCHYLATKFERCSKTSMKGLSQPNLKGHTNEHDIKKDIRGSFGFDWFGKSEYLYFDTITVGSLLQSQINEFYVLTDVTDESTPGKGQIAFKVYDLYFIFQKYSLKQLLDSGNNNGNHHFVSNVNVLFGTDCKDPRKDWTLYKSKPLSNHFKFPSYMSLERAPLVKPPGYSDPRTKILLPDGKDLKIVQLADLHMGVGENKCIDEFPTTENCHADPKTFKFINTVLDIEQPDLVVFTGDQIMGDRSIQDSESTLLKVVAPVIERQIPWAMVWGNHDDEGSLTRWELSELVYNLPFSLFKFSPFDTRDNSFGVGNYIQQVYNKSNPDDVLMTFYFMDSHKYSKTGKLYPGYDWIKEKQWDYIKDVYETNLYKDIPTDKPHISMAFFHIPLPEYLDVDSKKRPGEQNTLVGSFKEGVTAPKYNSGGLKILDDLGVQVTSCGHDHCNDYCLQTDSARNPIWVCFGGGAGEGGYAGYGGTERRIRMYDINPRNGNIYTWKRLNGSPNDKFDQQQL